MPMVMVVDSPQESFKYVVGFYVNDIVVYV